MSKNAKLTTVEVERRNALSLSDRQAKALRTFAAVGAYFDQGRVYASTRRSLIARGLLAHRVGSKNWGGLHLTEAGTAALKHFA